MKKTSPVRDLRGFLFPLLELAQECDELIASVAGSFFSNGVRQPLARFLFAGPPAGHRQIRLGIFAGLHGDEPAGCLALSEFMFELAAEPDIARGYDLVVYPMCNPTGFQDATRHNHAGKDLNREFWRSSAEPEVRILEAELREHRFDGIVALHADDTCTGLYGYAHDRLLNESLLRPALAASECVLPRDGRALIDGFPASEGIIRDCFPGVLSAPPEQRPQPFDIIFETPALQPLELQSKAAGLALRAILDEYRGFISQAQYL